MPAFLGGGVAPSGRAREPGGEPNASVSSLNGSMNVLSQTEATSHHSRSLTHRDLCFD